MHAGTPAGDGQQFTHPGYGFWRPWWRCARKAAPLFPHPSANTVGLLAQIACTPIVNTPLCRLPYAYMLLLLAAGWLEPQRSWDTT